MQDKTIKKDHNIIIENRKSMTVSGITDVDSFDEKAICLYTQLGELTIQGRELHIDAMSVETGDMTITGDIWAVTYGDRDRKNPISALGRLFRWMFPKHFFPNLALALLKKITYKDLKGVKIKLKSFLRLRMIKEPRVKK